MFEKKLGKSIHFTTVFLSVISALMIFIIYKLFSGATEIFGIEAETEFEFWLTVVLASVTLIACFLSVIMLVRQLVKFQGTAFTVDREGIHDTFIGITIFAFTLILPVRLIPWSAVKSLEIDGNKLSFKLNRKEIDASPVAKFILGTVGYNFSHSSIKPKLNEEEIKTVTEYCRLQRDCEISDINDEDEKIPDEKAAGYSKGTKFLMTVLLIVNLLFLIFTVFDFSQTAEISCSLAMVFASLFGLEESSLFAESVHIADDLSIVYFQVEESVFVYIWNVIKIIHAFLCVAFLYKIRDKKPKMSAKKLSLLYFVCTVILAIQGCMVLQIAVHNRIEANENVIIQSQYGAEDIVISDYKDAEKVRVYILENTDNPKDVYFECAVDVTVNKKKYTFFGTDSTIYEDMEKFISYFDESIVEIDMTNWDNDNFRDFTYSGFEEEIDRIFKRDKT